MLLAFGDCAVDPLRNAARDSVTRCIAGPRGTARDDRAGQPVAA